MTQPSVGATVERAVLTRLACTDVLPVMCWRRAFPGVPEQGVQARGFVQTLLSGHSLLDDIVVVAAELFSNAVRHSRSALPGGLVVVEIRRWRRGVALAVVDQGGPGEPTPRPADETADPLCEGGRGLAVVAAYATWWKWRGNARGRAVTAFFWE
jgi:anti-sigma regulatory factor (Ser/Thr protein kinase)